jgi:hypothetical protein
MSLSLFTGPQHADTRGGIVVPYSSWTPTYGGVFDWQGVHTRLTVNALRAITAGGGLEGATQSENVGAAVSRQLTKFFNGELAVSYYKNDVLVPSAQVSNGGNGVSGSLSLHRQLREHFDIGLAYTHLHQSYPGIEALSTSPDRNRVSVSLSYQFQKPIGR